MPKVVAGCPRTFPGPSAVPALPDSSHPHIFVETERKGKTALVPGPTHPLLHSVVAVGGEAGVFSRHLAEVAVKTIPPPTSASLVWNTPEPHRGALALFSNLSAFPFQHFEVGTPNDASGKRSKGNLPGASLNGNSWNRQSAGPKA